MLKQILFFSVIIFLFLSCKKDNTSATPYITNPTSYVLKRQTWSGPTTNGSSFSYSYNSDHLVSNIEEYQWTGISPNIAYDTARYSFEYTNGLCTKMVTSDGGANGYYIYEYNADKLPVKRTLYYSNGNVQSYDFYEYDNSNNLIQVTDSSQQLNFRYEFTYNVNNNLVSVTNYILWSTPQQKVKLEWSSFDNSINFIKSVNGLPPTFVWDNNFHAYSSSSPNNSMSEIYYVPVNIDQPFGSPNNDSYSYEYNEEGLPTVMHYGVWNVTFEYEKYR